MHRINQYKKKFYAWYQEGRLPPKKKRGSARRKITYEDYNQQKGPESLNKTNAVDMSRLDVKISTISSGMPRIPMPLSAYSFDNRANS